VSEDFAGARSRAAVVADLSPEARRTRAMRGRTGLAEAQARLGPGSHFHQIITRVWTGVINDGFIHAGNFAYMMLIALFPFCIIGAATFSLLGEPGQRAAAVDAILLELPPIVAQAIEPVARSVVLARQGWLLWLGGVVGLWTVGSLVETVRDVLRRAYGTQWEHGYWRYRLASTALILASMVLLIASIGAQVAITAAQQAIEVFAPRLTSWVSRLALSRFVPALGLYASLYLLYLSLTPKAYRSRTYPKWPGALFVTTWWLAVMGALPAILHTFFKYDLTYGSLAGVMISLFFFWLVGLGVVVGAELNAALVESPEERDMLGQADNRERATPAGRDK
jgi:membrane protein